MKSNTEDLELKTIVISLPSSYKVLEKYGLDYCCGGNKTLKNACEEKSLNYKTILSEISSHKKEALKIDLNNLSLTELVNHIENTHHVFMRQETPEIVSLIDKVNKVHQTKDLESLQNIFQTLLDEITEHLKKEENILFPAIKELEQHGSIKNFACADRAKNPLATIANPIKQMELEHTNAGQALEQINAIIDKDDFAKCASLKLLYDKLKNFQEDLHLHIHKENYILFPKTIALESKK